MEGRRRRAVEYKAPLCLIIGLVLLNVTLLFFLAALYHKQQLEVEDSHDKMVESLRNELQQIKVASKADDDEHLQREKLLVKLTEENEALRAMIKNCKRDKTECSKNGLTYPRKYKRLTVVMPFTQKHILRTKENLEKWGNLFPCEASKGYAVNIDFILYYNMKLGTTTQEHEQNIKDIISVLESNGAIKCVNAIHAIAANLSTKMDQDLYTHKAIATQFFNMFRNHFFTSNYDYLFYMEPDAGPIRSNWLDRIYEEVEFVTDFWVKGSIYRGPTKPKDYCYNLYSGCAEHMNGNSIYKLGDPDFNRFLNEIEQEIDLNTWNYDTYIMYKLKREENFPIYQKYAHKFVYTEVIQHGQNDILVSQVLEQFPDTYLLHQARYVW